MSDDHYDPTKKFASVMAVAKYTCTSPAHVRNLVKRGDLVAYTFGHRVLILTSSLEKLLNQPAAEPVEP